MPPPLNLDPRRIHPVVGSGTRPAFARVTFLLLAGTVLLGVTVDVLTVFQAAQTSARGKPGLPRQRFPGAEYINTKADRACYTTLMSPFYTDTSPAMEALQVELLRSVPPWRKMEMLAGLNASARNLAIVGLRQRFPHAAAAELNRRLADLLLGPDLARKVLGEAEDAA